MIYGVLMELFCIFVFRVKKWEGEDGKCDGEGKSNMMI